MPRGSHSVLIAIATLPLLVGCPDRPLRPFRPAPPPKSLEQIIADLNANARLAQTIFCENLKLKAIQNGKRQPRLTGKLAIQKPLFFRLHGKSARGLELDAGANDKLFWMWMLKENVAYVGAKSKLTAPGPARGMGGAVHPLNLLDALMIRELPYDPARQSLEVTKRQYVVSFAGPSSKGVFIQRKTYIDRWNDLVEKHELFDRSRRKIGAAHLSDFKRHRSGLRYPQEIVLKHASEGNELELTIDVGDIKVNSQLKPTLWGTPQFEGAKLRNIYTQR